MLLLIISVFNMKVWEVVAWDALCKKKPTTDHLKNFRINEVTVPLFERVLPKVAGHQFMSVTEL